MRALKLLGRLAARHRGLTTALVVGASAAPSFATTYTDPVGLAPTDVIGYATGPLVSWLAAGLPVVIAFALLAAVVSALKGWGRRAIKGR